MRSDARPSVWVKANAAGRELLARRLGRLPSEIAPGQTGPTFTHFETTVSSRDDEMWFRAIDVRGKYLSAVLVGELWDHTDLGWRFVFCGGRYSITSIDTNGVLIIRCPIDWDHPIRLLPHKGEIAVATRFLEILGRARHALGLPWNELWQ